jgi:hypothetical protein
MVKKSIFVILVAAVTAACDSGVHGRRIPGPYVHDDTTAGPESSKQINIDRAVKADAIICIELNNAEFPQVCNLTVGQLRIQMTTAIPQITKY